MPDTVTFLPKKRQAATKTKLIEAGVRLFTRQKGKGLTSRELAKEARVNHALISYHFGGMAELMAEVVERCIQDLRAEFLPQVERFEHAVRCAEADSVNVLLQEYVQVLFDILAGPDGETLLKAFSSPESAVLQGVYGRFAEQVLRPLHHSFAVASAKVRGIDEQGLEAAVLGQCMTAQCMAFFRGASTVLAYLEKKSFTAKDNEDISRIVAESLSRTASLGP